MVIMIELMSGRECLDCEVKPHSPAYTMYVWIIMHQGIIPYIQTLH